MINIIVCEDTLLCRKAVLSYLDKIISKNYLSDKVQIRLETDSPKDVLDYTKNFGSNDDLFILDINLKGEQSGISLAQEIRNHLPDAFISFLSSHSEMILFTIEKNIKPIDFIVKGAMDLNAKLENLILKSLEHIALRNPNDDSIQKANTFQVKTKEKVYNIDFDDIMFFESLGSTHKIRIHTCFRPIEFYGSISKLEAELDDRFIKCHRAYLVNKTNIVYFDKNSLEVKTKSGESCYASVRNISKLLKDL